MDDDTRLIARSLEGDRKALEALLERHRTFIYNVALKFFNNIEEAQDATQEVLLKTLSRLSTYDESKAAFRTWLYRITFHHFLNAKQNAYEKNITGFPVFYDLIESVPSQDLDEHEEKALALDVQESLVSCTAGMIMCLDREQRLVYIVGDVFEIGHVLAAEALEITPDNFRQRLSRARRDLHEWMHRRCGLVNLDNPCRCPKKTKGFIAKGWVNPDNRKWHSGKYSKIHGVVQSRMEEVLLARDRLYNQIYKEHPYKEPAVGADALMAGILDDPTFRGLFDLTKS
ncbi:MAG: RNA polymerase sigma factor [Fibrobacterota bacterium]|nr:RNA polymerase sigma factor [Fibrobacterota bacterium]QQS04561.1 MAG: RNA polymerase sigma factor [Fibrobacterota bacterium]